MATSKQSYYDVSTMLLKVAATMPDTLIKTKVCCCRAIVFLSDDSCFVVSVGASKRLQCSGQQSTLPNVDVMTCLLRMSLDVKSYATC